ncbi:MAG: MFS transporter [Eubacterium sp.]|nr:MFS transporter [Eubacterium sp.]
MDTKTKNSTFNLGIHGYGVIILAFCAMYLYSALMNDSLNIMIPALAKSRELDPAILYTFSSIATVIGVVSSVLWGRMLQVKNVKKTWIASLLVVAVFAFIWSFCSNYVIYGLGYIACYAGCMGCGQICSNNIIANWFPKKRGVAMGLATAGFPLSAATTSLLCNAISSRWDAGNFYRLIAVANLILMFIIIVYLKDFPEQRGCYPDNNKDYDFEEAKRELDEGLKYLETSPWTIKRVMKTPRIWQVVFGVGMLGLLSMGIMSNFINKNLEFGYQIPEILGMLAIAGVCAIPGSIFIGWLDTRFGTKIAGCTTYILGICALIFNLTHIHPLHYIALPFLALMLGGASNVLVSVINGIWGRYDFKRAYRVAQPSIAILQGVGITLVGVVGTKLSYVTAYRAVLVLAIVGFILFITLKIKEIVIEK